MIERSRAGASDIVRTIYEQLRAAVDDAAAKRILTETLLTDVFARSWESQFEDNPAALRRQLKEIVGDAIEADRLGGAP